MTINTTSLLKVLLSLLLITSLLVPSFHAPVIYAETGPDDGTRGEGEGEGPGSTPDPDSDGDGQSDAAEAEASAATAESVATNANAMGVDVSVEPVDTTNDPNAKDGSQVSINGISMSEKAANEAISAIAAANDKGLGGHVDTAATLGRHAANTACSGCVVGRESGVMGHPEAVSHAEIDVTLSTQDVVSARTDSAVPVTGKDISQALTNAHQQFANSARQSGILSLSGTTRVGPDGTAVTQSTINSYQDFANSMRESGNISLTGMTSIGSDGRAVEQTTTNTSYTYDPDTGSWIGNQNGRPADINTFPDDIHNNLDKISQSARENAHLDITIDIANDVVTAVEKETGAVRSYDPVTGQPVSTPAGVESSSKQSSLANAYQDYANSMIAAGQQGSNLSGIKSNDYYTFNPTSGNFVGNKNGVEVAPTNIPNGQAISDLAKTVNPNAVVVGYDAKTDKVALSNVYTGWRGEFNSRSTEDITRDIANYQSNPDSIDRESEIDFAAAYSDKIAANQAINPVPSSDPDRDAERMAAISYFESTSIRDPKTRQLDMEVMTNRALHDKKSIQEVLSAKWQFEPVVREAARSLCNCTNPSKPQMSRAASNKAAMTAAVESLTAKAKAQDPNFTENVALAKSMLSGKHVMGGLTKDQTNRGYYNFANDVTVQAIGSKSAKAWSGAMKSDRNSVTIANAKNPNIQHTYGIAPKQTTVDWTANAKNTFTIESLGDNVPDISDSYEAPSRSSDSDSDSTPSAKEVGTAIGGIIGGETGSRIGGLLGGLLDGILGGRGGGGNTIPDFEGEGEEPCEPNCEESVSDQSATLVLSGANFTLKNLISWLLNRSQPATETVVDEDKKLIQVLVTINDRTDQIELERPDIIETLKNPSAYYTETEFNELISRLEEEFPILFDEDGQVVYSNGLYSPAVEDGVLVSESDSSSFAYLVEHIGENGQRTETGSMSEDVVTRLIRTFTSASSNVYLEDISSVTYRLVDPDPSIPRDEYYDYVLHLHDGTTRGITVPQYSSVNHMEERFGQIGYKDDVVALVAQAEETDVDVRSVFGRFMDGIKGLFTELINDTETDTVNTDLTDIISGDITVDAVETLFIYPVVDVPCPDTSGFGAGFMYMAVIKDAGDPNHVLTVTDARCGQGDLKEMITEAARDLQETYGVKNAFSAAIEDKVHIYTGAVPYNPGVISTNLLTEPVEEPAQEVTEIESPTTSNEPLPNLTNTIRFEVKAVGSNGEILSDWTETEDITISSGVQLYFRWDASDYQQCLPFLNDNGNYSLTRENRAMISGNTEVEEYSITERTGVYKIECGGQRNNEFGVDYREIEVTIQ